MLLRATYAYWCYWWLDMYPLRDLGDTDYAHRTSQVPRDVA